MADVASSFREHYLRAFRLMVLARVLDDKMASLYRGGKIHMAGVFLRARPVEALSVSVGLALRKGDVFAPSMPRTARVVHGFWRTCPGRRPHLPGVRPLGPMRGRDGNVHRGRPREGYMAMISHLGAMLSVVNGTLLARRFKKIEGDVGATCIGEGGTSTGAFHEGLNQAAVEKLPLVVVVSNNQFAY